MRRWFCALGLTLAACFSNEPQLRPTSVSQRGGIELLVDTAAVRGSGAAIVLVDGVPANTVVIEAPGLLRAQLPTLPRTGRVDVEVLFADGTTIVMDEALEVLEPELEVRARH
jgi:hypothetical protein